MKTTWIIILNALLLAGTLAVSAAPLPTGTLLQIEAGVGSAANAPCPVGSCFGTELAPGLNIWTDFRPGTDGGLILGKNQQSGGQDLGPSSAKTAPGELTDSIAYLGNYATFATAPLGLFGSEPITTGAETNLFNDASCTGAACLGKTVLGAWHYAWNGNAIPLGSANGCTDPNCTPEQSAGIMVSNWTVQPDGTYVLNYSSVFPNTSFKGVRFTLLLRGKIQVPQPLVAGLSHRPAVPELNEKIAFTDTSVAKGTVTGRSWDFGDGAVSTASNPLHAYANPGTYVVRLTVTDDGGRTSTVTKELSVIPKPPYFIDLPVMRNAPRYPNALSADGSVMVGTYRDAFSRPMAYRWTRADGAVFVGPLWSYGSNVSGDGSAIVGQASSRVFRWSALSGFLNVGLPLYETQSAPNATSSDGAIIVGTSAAYSYGSTNYSGFWWTAPSGFLEIGNFLVDVSADGRTAVGELGDASRQVFRWAPQTGMQLLPSFGLADRVSAVSADGNVLVGASAGLGWRWSAADGFMTIGSEAKAISRDGSLVVGKAYDPIKARIYAFIWDRTNGVRDLNTVLATDYGANLGGMYLDSAYAISDDGTTLLGTGVRPDTTTGQWLARFAPSAPSYLTPRINGFWPAAGAPNAVVFVFGAHFKVGQAAQPLVRFNGVRAPITQALTDDLILTLVPPGDTAGPITVETVAGSPLVTIGSATSAAPFGNASVGLAISGFWPGQGAAGSFVFVFGAGFVPQATQVKLNGAAVPLAQVLDPGLLVFQVPNGAASGVIGVTTSGGTVSSGTSFTVNP